jgi:glucose-6-phosphate-specific signal transduction histidine kinase
VHLNVTDDGEHTVSGPRQPGYGLVGMAERVSLLGGTLEAGPNSARGWTVQATIPRHEAPR